MLFELENSATSRRTHCGVLEFIAEEGTCYLPYWMMQNLLLTEGSQVKVVNTSLPKGTYVKLQPCTKDFLDVFNPKAVLENSLRNFATLTKGDNIVINYNNRTYEIEIADTKPSNAISIIEADVNVDFAPPKDYIEPSAVPQSSQGPSVAPSPVSEEEVKPGEGLLFGGEGQRIDGKKLKEHQKNAQPVVVGKKADPWGPEPWMSRVPGGVRRDPPYGYMLMMKEKKMTVPNAHGAPGRDEPKEGHVLRT